MTKLFPVNQVTRIVFDDDCQIQFVDIVEIETGESFTFSPFVTGFSSAHDGDKILLSGGIRLQS